MLPAFHRTEKHATGKWHHAHQTPVQKALRLGSYNWTRSATTINDEILEIGTDLRSDRHKKHIETTARRLGQRSAAAPVSIGTIDYTEAGAHIGDLASVRGTLIEAYTSKSGTVFLDFCKSYKSCPFSGVIFADDAKKFGDLSRYVGTTITLTGKISSYQSKAEIILSNPNQISK